MAAGPAIQTFTPRSANQITNLDVLRQQIRNYYGDPMGTGILRQRQQLRQGGQLGRECRRCATSRRTAINIGLKAIVLDVDDTTLATWNYEIFSNWAYNPTTNATYVNGQLFPAVPGMVDMVTKAAKEGYAIIFITGRPAAQEAATLGNLTSDGIGVDAGYPAPTTLVDGEDGLFTKPAVADYPDLPQDRLRGRDRRRQRRARRSTTSPPRGPTSSRWATTSWPTSATSSATSRAASRTRPSSCRTRTTTCRNPGGSQTGEGPTPTGGGPSTGRVSCLRITWSGPRLERGIVTRPNWTCAEPRSPARRSLWWWPPARAAGPRISRKPSRNARVWPAGHAACGRDSPTPGGLLRHSLSADSTPRLGR